MENKLIVNDSVEVNSMPSYLKFGKKTLWWIAVMATIIQISIFGLMLYSVLQESETSEISRWFTQTNNKLYFIIGSVLLLSFYLFIILIIAIKLFNNINPVNNKVITTFFFVIIVAEICSILFIIYGLFLRKVFEDTAWNKFGLDNNSNVNVIFSSIVIGILAIISILLSSAILILINTNVKTNILKKQANKETKVVKTKPSQDYVKEFNETISKKISQNELIDLMNKSANSNIALGDKTNYTNEKINMFLEEFGQILADHLKNNDTITISKFINLKTNSSKSANKINPP